jgi:hypothetical protein
VYSTEVNGEILEFGTSGMLYRSNKLMYDRATQTLWNQFLGEPAVGPLADSGIRLELLPVVTTTWVDWVTTHPDTTVLDADTGVYAASSYFPEENPRSFYYSYRNDPETMFPVWQRNDRLDTKSQVLGVRLNGQAKAYPLEALVREPVVNDSLGGQDLVVLAQSEAGAARAYRRDANTFSPAREILGEGRPTILLDQEGNRWTVDEEALVFVDDPSRRLERLPAHMAYWFGWYGFHPATEVYGQP